MVSLTLGSSRNLRPLVLASLLSINMYMYLDLYLASLLSINMYMYLDLYLASLLSINISPRAQASSLKEAT